MSDETNDLEHFAMSSVLPKMLNETGEANEPLTEVLIAESISGGADYRNDMPRELILTRRLLDGTEYTARYEQVGTTGRVTHVHD